MNLVLHLLILFLLLLIDILVVVLHVLAAPLNVPLQIGERCQETQIHPMDLHLGPAEHIQLLEEPCWGFLDALNVVSLERIENLGHRVLELAACP